MKRAVIARLLHLANSSPPAVGRTEFYALKERLCRRYGRMEGYDLQHIVKSCWDCDGRKGCWRCGGSGVYSQVWVYLERWRIGGYVFHKPIIRHYTKPETLGSVTFNGYVQHADYGWRSREAMLWLAFFYDRNLWLTLLRGSSPGRWVWMPMLVVNRIVFKLSLFLTNSGNRKCIHCGKRIYRFFTNSIHFTCKACDRRERTVEDLPF